MFTIRGPYVFTNLLYYKLTTFRHQSELSVLSRLSTVIIYRNVVRSNTDYLF